MPFDVEIVAKALAGIEDDVRTGFGEMLAPRDPDAFARELHGADLDPEAVFATSEHFVVTPWVYRCTHVREFLGVPPTFVDLDLRGTTFAHACATDSEEWEYYRDVDDGGALHQLGVSTTARPALTPDEFNVWRDRNRS